MASRNCGKRKSLRDISQSPLSKEESNALAANIATRQEPIVTALLGLALIDNQLDSLLRSHFSRRDDNTWLELTGEKGPLSTFYNKIITAYAFGICNAVVRDGLNTVRKIRNAFAHSKRPLVFSNELIVRELTNISLPEGKRSRLYKDLDFVREMANGTGDCPQIAYSMLCLTLELELVRRESARLKTRARRATKQRSALARALLRSTPMQPALGLGSILASRTVNPTTSTPQPSQQMTDLLGDYFDDNKGKK